MKAKISARGALGKSITWCRLPAAANPASILLSCGSVNWSMGSLMESAVAVGTRAFLHAAVSFTSVVASMSDLLF